MKKPITKLTIPPRTLTRKELAHAIGGLGTIKGPGGGPPDPGPIG